MSSRSSPPVDRSHWAAILGGPKPTIPPVCLSLFLQKRIHRGMPFRPKNWAPPRPSNSSASEIPWCSTAPAGSLPPVVGAHRRRVAGSSSHGLVLPDFAPCGWFWKRTSSELTPLHPSSPFIAPPPAPRGQAPTHLFICWNKGPHIWTDLRRQIDTNSIRFAPQVTGARCAGKV